MSDMFQVVTDGFFNSPLWHRVWIIQELALAASIEFNIGEHALELKGLRYLCLFRAYVEHNHQIYEILGGFQEHDPPDEPELRKRLRLEMVTLMRLASLFRKDPDNKFNGS